MPVQIKSQLLLARAILDGSKESLIRITHWKNKGFCDSIMFLEYAISSNFTFCLLLQWDVDMHPQSDGGDWGRWISGFWKHLGISRYVGGAYLTETLNGIYSFQLPDVLIRYLKCFCYPNLPFIFLRDKIRYKTIEAYFKIPVDTKQLQKSPL